MRIGPVVGLLLAACVAFGAAAQEKQDDTAGLLRKADELAAGGRMAEALSIWAGLVETLPAAERQAVHLKLADAYRKYGKLPEAWYNLDQHVRLAGEAAAAAADRDALAAALEKGHCRGDVTVDPPDARVFLAEGATGPSYPAPLSWWFRAGTAQVHATREGFEAKTLPLPGCEAGARVPLGIQLHPLKQEGVLKLAGSEVGAQVFVDGTFQGTIPVRLKLPAGRHELTVVRAGRLDWTKTVDIAPGDTLIERPILEKGEKKPAGGGTGEGGTEPTRLVAPVEARKPASQAWKWGIVGGGAALLAAGAVFHSIAWSRNEDLKKQYPDGTPTAPAPASYPARYRQAYDSDVAPMATLSWVLYGVGGAAAAAGTALMFLDLSGGGSAWLAPVPAEGCLGLSAGMAF